MLTLISAVFIVVFFVPYTASGFAACGKLFNSLFGVDYHAAMIISAIVIMFYTAMGGFLAASTTDFIQSIVMSFALILILVFGTIKAGGMGAVMDNAKAIPGYLTLTASHDAVTKTSSPYTLLTIFSTLAWGLGYFGMPHILLRFMAIEDDRKLRLSRRVASVWVVISMCAALLIGMVGLQMSKVGAVPTLEGSESETIIVKIADLLASNGVLAALFAGIVLSGILAATMSTADSQLLAASSSVSNDILVKFFGIKLKERRALLISRISLIIIAVVAVFLAWNQDSSVFRIVSFAWGGFGGAFGPVVLLALFWRRSNRKGAIVGMLAGGIMIFVWKFGVRPMGGILDIYELLPAFLTGLFVNVIVSLLTAKPEKNLTDIYDEVTAMK